MPDNKMYSYPLLKIGAWRKSLGDTVKLYSDRLPEPNEFDEIWLTTVFTFDILHALGLVREATKRCKVVKVGGISATLFPDKFRSEGVEVHTGLIPEAEHFHPDYSILPETPKYSIVHTSRGCVRKCGFCMVTKLEPVFSHCPDWEKSIHPKTTRVLFYDNNFLAKDIKQIREDTDKMKQLVAEKRVKSFDFNQALDPRLLTDEQADLLEGIPITPMRFAFDGMHEDGHFQRAIEKMAKRGFKEFVNLMLYNFTDTPADMYYRIREAVRLSRDLDIQCKAFPMRYQPIMELDNQRGYIGKHWTKQTRSAFMYIMSTHSGGRGVVSCVGCDTMTAFEEFEYWFGKNVDEFLRLLNYPNLRIYMQRKRGALRIDRAIKAIEKDVKRAGE